MLNRSPLCLLILAGSLAGASLLSGCDRSAEASKAVRDAADKLALVGSDPFVSPLTEKREATLREVLALVQPHISADSPAIAAAANLLAARAQIGLAEVKAAAATDLERQAQYHIASLRTKAEVWFSESNRAQEAEAYDPTNELAAIDKAASEAEAAIGATAGAQRQAEERVAAFEREANGVLAKARAKRDEAVKLRQGLGDASATQGLSLLERAAVIGREADALDMQVADIRNKAYAARPAVDDAIRTAQLLTSRRDSLAKLRETVVERGRAAKARGAESRTAANAAASEINTIIGEMTAFRSGDLSSAYEAALKDYREALASAKKAQQGATGESKTTAALAAASCQHGLADVLLLRARGTEVFSIVLKTLGSKVPALPGNASLNAAASEQSEAAKSLLAEAGEAYGAARDAYQSAGAKNQTAEQVDKLTKMLDQLAGSGMPPASEIPPASEVEPPAATDGAPVDGAPVDEAAEIAAIQKALEDFVASIESNSVPMAMASFYVNGEAEEEAMDSVIEPMLNLAALDSALRAKFNAGFADMMPVPMGPGAASPFSFKVSELEIKITGPTTATVSKPGSPAMQLQKANGDRWLMIVPAGTGAAAGPMKDLMKPLGDAAAEMTPDVAAGKFKTKEEFQMALSAKLMPLMQKMMPGGLKPPGGG